MRIWFDALTGKHVRYAVAVADRLRKENEIVLTTRKHPDTLPLIEFLDEKFIVTGTYSPASLLTRLRDGIERQSFFCRFFEENPADIAISHGSVDQCRVAFGLGKTVITTIDTPYADAVNRLTLPLANYVVVSKAIPKEILQSYGVRGEIVDFDGVDEVAWIKDFKPAAKYDFGRPLIVVRELEERAAYAKGKVNLTLLAKKLTDLGKVVLLSRYERKAFKDLTVPKDFVDSVSLVANADLFIGVGGTITREAALQGTPAIIINMFPNQYVNDFLCGKGFPIFRSDYTETLRLAEKLLGKRRNVKQLLFKLENPIDIIEKIVKRKIPEG